MSLNTEYQKLLKHLKRNTKSDVSKRAEFQESLQTLFDIASPEAVKKLKKDKVLGSKKALEDISFLESQRTDRAAKMVNHDTNHDRNVIKHKVK